MSSSSEESDRKGIQIPLKRNWDDLIHLNSINYNGKSEQDLYVTRKNIEDIIREFIYGRKEGALLVAGKRGIGKTSIIIKAINEIQNNLCENDKSILPILIHAPTLDLKEEKNIDSNFLELKRNMLQSLIRRLYKQVKEYHEQNEKNKKHKDKNSKRKFLKINLKKEIVKDGYDLVSELYQKALAKEYKKEDFMENLSKETDQLEKKILVSVKGIEKILVIIFFFIVAGIVAFNPIPMLERIWNNVLSLLIAFVPLISIVYKWDKLKNRLFSDTKKASSYYLYDHNTSTLEYELEETLKKLSEQYKTIFIIDELDKIKRIDVIIDVIASLKPLLTNSSAIFILVVDEEIYDIIVNSTQRNIYHTIFKQKIFLDRPLRKTINSYLTNITKENQQKLDGKFCDYICFISKSIFFDVSDKLKDHIMYTNNSLKLNVVLEEEQEVKANLQNLLWITNDKYRSDYLSETNKNESLLDTLYDLITNLDNMKINTILVKIDTKIDHHDTLIINSPSLPDFKIVTSNEKEKEALNYLIYLLEESKYLWRNSSSDDNYIEYIKKGIISDIPVDIRLTDYEKVFVDKYQELMLYLEWFNEIYTKN